MNEKKILEILELEDKEVKLEDSNFILSNSDEIKKINPVQNINPLINT